jgi:two-component system chemotaxis response regulator CheY
MSLLKAMVVEDSLPNQNILALTLKRMGFEVESFANGEDAWNRLSLQPSGWAFVFTDIMMPKMDGLTLLQRIRAHGELKTLLVFMLTAMSDKTYVIEAKKHGVNGYIIKPISYVKVLAKLRPLFPDMKFPEAA